VPESVLFSKMKKPEAAASGFLLAPPVGLEPTTLRLNGRLTAIGIPLKKPCFSRFLIYLLYHIQQTKTRESCCILTILVCLKCA